jgi:hypothetical protein
VAAFATVDGRGGEMRLGCPAFVIVLVAASSLSATFAMSFAQTDAVARAELAPSGTLRAAINVGNPVLASRDSATGEPRGVSVDLARELAKRLNVPFELLYPSRELKHAKVIHAPTSQAVTDAMVAGNLEVAAGVKQQLEADARRTPGLRVLDGRFMVIRQAMALPKARPAGANHLAAFIEDITATAFVAASLTRHGIEGAIVAPPGR